MPTTHTGITNRINARAPLYPPAFVFIGELDTVITPDMSVEAATKFADATVSRSATIGHFLPSASDASFAESVAFLRANLNLTAAPPSAPPSPAAPPSSSSSSLPVILGAVGGVAVLALVGLAIWYYLRVKRAAGAFAKLAAVSALPPMPVARK